MRGGLQLENAGSAAVDVAFGHVPRKLRLEMAAAVKRKATASAPPLVSAPLACERPYS